MASQGDKIAKVNGVLKNNIDIRNEHLLRNNDIYRLFNGALIPNVGEYYEIGYRKLSDFFKDSNELIGYTHDNKSPYSTSIRNKYFNGKDVEEHEIYKVISNSTNFLRWRGKYDDYREYIQDRIGYDVYTRHIRFIDEVLSAEFIEYGLKLSQVGVIRDINVAAALTGVITTNTNNFSGLDTRLGRISNQMYAVTLNNASTFNSSRRRYEFGDKDKNSAYITPFLYTRYGNNDLNVFELSNILRVGDFEKRVREDLGGDVKFAYNPWENVFSNSQLVYLDDVLKYNIYGFSNGEKSSYAFDVNDNDYFDLTHSVYDDTDAMKTILASNTICDNETSNSASGRLNTTSTYRKYNEGDSEFNKVSRENIVNETEAWDVNSNMDDNPMHESSLLKKTNDLFNQHKISTIVGRFHTGMENGLNSDKEFTDTAKSEFGNSHGRNLLKLDALVKNYKTNDYSDPYCRVWTYHHQYNQVKKLIRPFMYEDETGRERIMKMSEVQSMNAKYRSVSHEDNNTVILGDQYLAENTVIGNNGFVNIVPSNDTDNKVDIKKCMFSIENLAWKDVPNIDSYLNSEQRGPNGGRIMWFPPYDLDFNESINVNWNQNSFIGRGEKVYTYNNTDRTGTLSFSMIIDHPSIINSLRAKEGKGEEKDLEADVLRFFAGCDILDVDKEITPTTGETIPIIPPEVIPSDKDEVLKFYVYYPNNYSGVLEPVKKDSNTFDEDWYGYLLTGFDNIKFDKDNISKWTGYEMIENTNGGITQNMTSYTDEYTRPTCMSTKNWTECKNSGGEYTGKDAKQRYYRYRVDFDLHQKLWRYENYNDSKSYALNSIMDEEVHKGATCTFAEFLYAALKTKANKLGFDSTFVSNYENFIKNNAKVDIENERVTRIISALSNPETKFTKFVFYGGATEQDQKNQNHLANRRVHALENLITSIGLVEDKNKLAEDGNWSVSIDNLGSLKDKTTVNSKESKSQRYACVEIHYNRPETKRLNEANYEAKLTDEERLDKFVQYLEENIYLKRALENPYLHDIVIDKIEELKIDYKNKAIDLQALANEKSVEIYQSIDGLDEAFYVCDEYFNIDKYNDYYLYSVKAEREEYLSDRPDEIDYEYAGEMREKMFAKANEILNKGDEDVAPLNELLIGLCNYNSYDLLDGYIDYAFTQIRRFNKLDDYIAFLKVYSHYDKVNDDTLNTITSDEANVIFDSINKQFDVILAPAENAGEFYIVGMGQFVEIYKKLNIKNEENVERIDDDTEFINIAKEATSGQDELYSYFVDAMASDPNSTEKIFEIKYFINHKDDETFNVSDYILKLDVEHFEMSDLLIDTRDSYEIYYNAYNILLKQENEKQFELANAKKAERQKIKKELKEIQAQLEHQKELLKNTESEFLANMEEELKIAYETILTEAKKPYNEKEAKKKEIAEQNKKAEEERLKAEEQAKKEELDRRWKDGIRLGVIPASDNRYETEADYFNKLKMDDPLMFKNITDKFKYFNPAYHSLSPEGFNARLNFLHQCTRQGHTIEASARNGYAQNAGNLSFGRMPVCVLRIGDFINTRVIINSITINYAAQSGIQWDLNQEGAGVQPMYAKISMQIVLLGGQSLEGPISKLQNAVSFNYYANTPVYDNRADMAHPVSKSVETDTDVYGIEYTHTWLPNPTN